MKKILSIIISIAVIAGVLAACGSGKDNSPVSADSEKLKIVTTIFPEYDWVKQILGDRFKDADVTMLLDSGVDLHSYQPTASDIVKISSCDMFIYVGGESDKWVEDAFKEAVNDDMVVINLLEALGEKVKAEEIKEGMEAEHEHEHEEEYDEHVWLSLKNAEALCKIISEKLCEIDPENSDIYAANTEAYTEKLRNLDSEYADAVKNAGVKTLVFGDRFPFRYLVDDYGIDYFAAFVGCSAESEASFETVIFLAKKLDELGLKNVMQIESADGRLSQSVIDASKDKNREILTLDSMQSSTSDDIKNGKDYLNTMQNNLEILKKALSSAK